MLIKIMVLLVLLAGAQMLYGSFFRQGYPLEMPVDLTWWNGLTAEWKTILLINQNFQKQQVDIFALHAEYINRLNAAGEANYTEMNRSLYQLSEDRRFGSGYNDLYARALRKKHMVMNDTIDLSMLGNLETVYMVNGPADLGPLKKLTHLKVLIINYCGIDVSVPVSRGVVDLEPLRNLKDLRVLHCSSPALQSLAPIKELVNLEELRCDNSNVTSIAPLKKMSNLKRLTIGSKVTDAAIIASFKNLEELNMPAAKNIPDLSKMKRLEKLCITESEMVIVDSRYRISNLNFVSGLSSLVYIDLGHTSYRGSLEPLSLLQQLKAITLPPVSRENMLQFKNRHTNCIIINAFQYER